MVLTHADSALHTLWRSCSTFALPLIRTLFSTKFLWKQLQTVERGTHGELTALLRHPIAHHQPATQQESPVGPTARGLTHQDSSQVALDDLENGTGRAYGKTEFGRASQRQIQNQYFSALMVMMW